MKFTFSYYRKRGLPFVSFIRTLGRPRQRWEDNIKNNLKETGWESADWFHPYQDRENWRAPVNTEMNSWVPQNAGEFLTGSEAIRFSRTLLTGLSNAQV
jgi:hypothetical protein